MGDEQPHVAKGRLRVVNSERHSGVVTLLFTDVVGSTALKQRLGDRTGVDLLQEHHALVRHTLEQFPSAEEIVVAGDSFLVVFPVPSDAVKCAVLLQARLREFNQGSSSPMLDRMGLHMGEVRIERAASGARNVFGIQVDTCARVMSLAQGGQILMTRPVFDNARQSCKGEEIEGAGALSWLNHGQFELKGVEEPVEICEVRDANMASLSLPMTSEKARRLEQGEAETVLGWRPALGQVVPNTKWKLEEKLGEGGFGEVWKARHEALKEQRVFKFCFRADRVRSLKREVTLFLVLKERIGDHPNIVKLHDIYFDQPPYFLQEEYVSGRDLKHWCEAQGGVEKVPLEVRLEIVAQAADALQAAHDAGVIHRDVKPGNILLSSAKLERRGYPSEPAPPPAGDHRPNAKLTDFGIGQVISAEVLKDMTSAGFTQTLLGSDSSSHAGTQLYMAPELFEGKPASTRSDIYSLGVVLYQLVVGDFKRPLTMDWADEVPDPLLREDLHHCLAGKPGDRFAAAGLLAKNLRALPERRTERQRQEAQKALVERAAYRRGIMRAAAIASVVLAVIVVLALHARSNALAKVRQAAAMRTTAVRLTVANGLGPAESGDWLSAALWFSEAYFLEESFKMTPELNRQSHLLRINSVLRQSPRLERMWFDTVGVSGGFAKGETEVLLGTTNGYRLHSIMSGEPASPPVGRGNTYASVAPDGLYAVTGGGSTNSLFSLWSLPSGERAGYLREAGSEEPIRADCADLQFSRDGRWVAAAVSSPGDMAVDRVVIWEAKTGRVRHVIRYADALNVGWTNGNFLLAARFDPSGERVVTTGSDKRAVVWHWQTGEPPRVLQGHASWVYSACFGWKHTNWVATCSFDRTACIWDLGTGRPITRVEHEGDAIRDVQISPDDSALVTAGLDFSLQLWDTETGRLIPPILRSHDRVMQVQCSADGVRVLARNRDGTIRLWRLKGEIPMVEPSPGDYSTDGRRLLTLDEGSVRVQSAAGESAAAAVELTQTNVLAVAFAGESNRFLCFPRSRAPGSGQVELRDFAGKVPLGAPLAFDPSCRLVSCPAGKRFALFGGTNEKLPGGGHAVYIWEPEKGGELKPIAFTNETVEAVAFDHAGKWMAVGTVGDDTGAGVLRLVPVESEGKPIILSSGQQRISHLEFNRDDQWLVEARWDDDVNPAMAVVWRAATSGKPFVQEKQLPHLDGVLCATFSDSGNAIATGSEDQTAIVWQRSRGDWVPSLRALRCGGQVFLCAFSHNGRWLATAHRTPKAQQTGKWTSDVRIWDIAGNEARSLPFAFPGKLTRLSFAAGDTRLFVELRTLSEPPKRWVIDLATDEIAANELLLQTQLLSSQRSFLSGRAEHLTTALEGELSAENALLHATSIGPLRLLSKRDCQELWLHFLPPTSRMP